MRPRCRAGRWLYGPGPIARDAAMWHDAPRPVPPHGPMAPHRRTHPTMADCHHHRLQALRSSVYASFPDSKIPVAEIAVATRAKCPRYMTGTSQVHGWHAPSLRSPAPGSSLRAGLAHCQRSSRTVIAR